MIQWIVAFFILNAVSPNVGLAQPMLQPFQMSSCSLNKKCFSIKAPTANLSVAGTTISATDATLKIYKNRADVLPVVYQCQTLTYWSHSKNILCDNRQSKNKTTLLFDDRLALIQLK